MSRIDALMTEQCPDGVEYRPLGDVGELIRGRRFTKADVVPDGIGSIHYGEIYTEYGTWATSALSHVRADLAPSLRFAHPGDVVIAAVGETVEDVCKAVAWLGDDDVAVHDDCFIFRHELDPKFVSYYFQTRALHAEKAKYVARAKVKRVSGESLGKLRIPVPPLPIQREIASILDGFAELEAQLAAQLEAELEARRRQYDYYRDALLTFEPRERERERWAALSELAEIGTGSSNSNEALDAGEYPFFVRSQEVRYMDAFEFDETAIITSGDGVGVGKVFHFVEGKYALHQRAYRIHVTSGDLLPKFFFHYMRNGFGDYMQTAAVHSSVTSVRKPMLERYPVPLPSLREQERIVDVLDRLDVLVNGLSTELPAELRARRRQYEYYRDRLLTFDQAPA